MTYARDTSVSIDRSKAEIERTLQRYGADAFSYAHDQTRAMIQFRMSGKVIRFMLQLPDRNSDEFRFTPAKRIRRHTDDAYKAWEQACRQKWRALALVVKAKLEAVEAGISSLEEEFLSFIVLPSGERVGDWMLPQVEQAYLTGDMPPMLPAGRET